MDITNNHMKHLADQEFSQLGGPQTRTLNLMMAIFFYIEMFKLKGIQASWAPLNLPMHGKMLPECIQLVGC